MRWPGQLHRPGLDVFGGERRDQDGQVEQREPVEPVEAAGGDVAVDGHLDQVRLRQRGGAADDDRAERHADLPPVRPQVLQQPPHQPRVVGFAEDFVVVDGHRIG